MDKAVADAVKSQQKSWSFIIPFASETVMKYWLLPYDGKTRNGETCRFDFNADLSVFHTKKSHDGFMPVWVFYELINKGKFKNYIKNGIKFRPEEITARNFGKNRKIKFEGKLQHRINGRWISYVG